MWPRKYLLTTTLVASWLQNAGTSTSFCSKTVLPDSLPMLAVRISQVISSYGCTPGVVQRRGKVRPAGGAAVLGQAVEAHAVGTALALRRRRAEATDRADRDVEADDLPGADADVCWSVVIGRDAVMVAVSLRLGRMGAAAAWVEGGEPGPEITLGSPRSPLSMTGMGPLLLLPSTTPGRWAGVPMPGAVPPGRRPTDPIPEPPCFVDCAAVPLVSPEVLVERLGRTFWGVRRPQFRRPQAIERSSKNSRERWPSQGVSTRCSGPTSTAYPYILRLWTNSWMTARSDVDDPPSPVDGVWTSARPAGATARRGASWSRREPNDRSILGGSPAAIPERADTLAPECSSRSVSAASRPGFAGSSRTSVRSRRSRSFSSAARSSESRGRRSPRAPGRRFPVRLPPSHPCHRHGDRLPRGSACQRRGADRPIVEATDGGTVIVYTQPKDVAEHGRRRSRCAGVARPVGSPGGPTGTPPCCSSTSATPSASRRRPRDRRRLRALPARRRTHGDRRRLDGGLPRRRAISTTH